MRESRPDPRQNHTFLAEDIPAGEPLVFPHQAGALVGSVMPVIMPDGRLIWFPAPSFTALYLVEAKGHLDRGKRLRTRALAQLRTAHDEKLLVTDKQAVLDCFAEMTKAVLLSYAAVEAVVNEMIESQDEAFTIKHPNTRGEEQVLGKAEMVRRLSTSDKLHQVMPEITGEPSLKGTLYWERFVRVRRMRDALVHVKEGNYSADPDKPSTYGMLLRGDADDCVLDVCALITKLDPGRLSEAARKTLKIPTTATGTRSLFALVSAMDKIFDTDSVRTGAFASSGMMCAVYTAGVPTAQLSGRPRVPRPAIPAVITHRVQHPRPSAGYPAPPLASRQPARYRLDPAVV